MMDSTYLWVPPWPPLITIVAAAAGIGLIWWSNAKQPIESKKTRAILTTLRVLSFLTVLLMLYQLSYQPLKRLPAEILVCIDNSTSMQTIDASLNSQSVGAKKAPQDAVSRLNQAKSIFLQDSRASRDWRQRYTIRWHSLSGPLHDRGESSEPESALRPLRDLSADQPESAIGDMLLAAIREQQGRFAAAIVLATDGIVTQGVKLQGVIEAARKHSIPIFTIAVGSENPTRDIELSAPKVDPIAFVNDVVTVSCTVSAVGFGESQENDIIELRLLDSENGVPIATEAIRISELPQSIQFTDQPTTEGRREYFIETDVLDGESQSTNNQVSASVEVRDEKIRVLVVSSQPSYEYRFLKSLLDREAAREGSSIEVASFLQDGDPELPRIDRSSISMFPATLDRLLAFDVVICIDTDAELWPTTAKENLASAIQENGRSIVLLFGGTRDTLKTWESDHVLATLLPTQIPHPDTPSDHLVDPSRRLDAIAEKIRITSDGATMANLYLASDRTTSQRIWANLAEIYADHESRSVTARRLKRGCRVLAELETIERPLLLRRPAITSHFQGNGQVLWHGFDQTWRWNQLLADNPFGRYWLQTIRMLGRNKLILDVLAEIKCGKEAISETDQIPIQVTFYRNATATEAWADSALSAVVESQGNTVAEAPLVRNSIYPYQFNASLDALPAGQYTAWLKSTSIEPRSVECGIVVSARTSEQTQLATRFDELELLAEQTGGKAYTAKNASRLFRDLPRRNSGHSERLPPKALWNRPWVAALLVTLLTAEWLLRRRIGLP